MTLRATTPRPSAAQWHFFVDRGGTFTDIVARKPDGTLDALKRLSRSPSGDDPAIVGIRELMGVAPGAPLPSADIASIRIGTTVATNALLERKGDPTVLVVTAGFADALEIGTQARPDIFALRVVKPQMLYAHVIEARERLRADGTVEIALDDQALAHDLAAAFDRGLRCAAIAFLHGYAHPRHEQRAAEIAYAAGFTQVTVSHAVSGLVRFVPRADTTVADAYLSPVLRRYVDHVSAGLSDADQPHADIRHVANLTVGSQSPSLRLQFMMSSGGLAEASAFHGRDAILSGPAGGIVAMAEVAREAGFDRVIGFDMGGTSTDVSHYAGALERTTETVVAGVRVAVPMLAIHTVAAGGGSLLSFDGSRLRVGPESAGAVPGPMCYRRGGPLTVTDANVMLGRINSADFPAVFGNSGTQRIDTDVVRAAFASLASQIGGGKSPEALAEDFFAIAVENMANAIRKISVARGHDVSGYTLCCFGAAGGQAACAVATALGMTSVLIHPLSGLLSAYGIGLARRRAIERRSVEAVFDAPTLSRVRDLAASLKRELAKGLAAHGAGMGSRADLEFDAHTGTGTDTGTGTGTDTGTGTGGDGAPGEARIFLRYETSEAAVALPLDVSFDDLIARFEREHLAQFGFLSRGKSVHVASFEVEVFEDIEPPPPVTPSAMSSATTPTPTAITRIFHGGQWHRAAIYHRATLSPGAEIAGPAIVVEPHQTVVIDPGWQLKLTRHNNIVLTRNPVALSASAAPPPVAPALDQPDPARVELYNNRFMAIAEDMGEALRRTAQSVNIKERLDFSCAVFDAAGQLIANAPHVPVHLGSMDASVATVVRSRAISLRPGDSVMLNAPYNGGTHLPDITVVTPVFDVAGQSILFWLASRGHHEDIGGISPGSMSPLATHIDEEGVLIDDVILVERDRFLEAETRALLTGARYPVRRPDQNIADLKAQVAANARGAVALRALVASHGMPEVTAYMGHVLDAGEAAVRRLIARQFATWGTSAFRVETDSGAVIAVRITTDGSNRTAMIDFTGTSPQQSGNANAPEAVTRAAVLYCFRVLTGEAIPLNAGCLRPLTIVVPEGSMLAPRYPAAVVAGNTETSQIVTNAVFGALQALGSAQGTMNNLTFGNDRLQYYETICSGAPAGPGFDGAAGVHVHMTNTRMTDPEILELRYPVVVDRFSIRRGSGGRGRWRSGDGVVRSIRFLEPMGGAILSGGRRVAPFGVAGGDVGQCGRNTIIRANGAREDLGGSAAFDVAPGDTITIETPTGGGFGAPE